MMAHRESVFTSRPLIGITMGDPCGIGAETIVKALADPDVRRLGRFVIYGIDEVLNAAADAASIRPFWFHVPAEDSARVDSGVVVVDHCEFPAGMWLNARPTLEGGKCSLRFFDSAIDAARRGLIDAIVTGPIHKVSWQLAGCKFAGHTDKLGDAFNTKRYTMAFVGGGLRLALATVHVGIMELRDRISIGSVYQPIDLLHDALVRWFGVESPRIAVMGLNPHAGEEGRFGDEERRIIWPALLMAGQHGINVEGPFPADSFFANHRRLRFDGVVAMYHDQGLIPIKMLAFDSAVNLTLGLPVIRTSVDHGTAFDIAGTNSADPGSMKAAIRLAVDLAAQVATGARDATPESAIAVPPL
jgi:4-phospho-D-threonate 3-dehydrogenase / 4-phospho-D-erythronate 3-dehydrogenase